MNRRCRTRPAGRDRRAREIVLCCACALAAAWPAAMLHAASRPHYGGTLRVSFAQAAESLDPALAATLPERTLARAIYETLVDLDEAGAPAPALAASWESEAGGKRWVFHLRAGLVFHDGSPVTSGAVRASLERAVGRAPSAAAAELRRTQFLLAAPAPDRLTCDLAEPLPALPVMLADPTLSITGPDGAGTGPWKLASFNSGHARLLAFDAYRHGRPFLDEVEADFGVDARRQRVDFELKRADVLAAAPTEVRVPGLPGAAPPLNLLVLAFAPVGAPGRGIRAEPDAEARRSLLAAINRETLARLLPPGRAEAADAFLPGALSGYEFLFASGAERPRPPARPEAREYHLIYDDSDPLARLIASRLALDLRVAGFSLRPEGLPRAAFRQAREAAPFDLVLESVPLHAENPPGALADLFARFAAAGAREMLGTAPGAIEAEYRAQKTALDEARVIPLLHYRDAYAFQPGLEQVRLDASGLLDLANAWKK